MASGVVKFFNSQKGWGFLSDDSGGPDVFVHIKDLQKSGIARVTEGQALKFDVVAGRNGTGPKAANLATV